MRAFIALAICAVLQRCACWDLESLSPAQWAIASANWNATMEAHRHMLQATPTGTCNNDMRKSMPPYLQLTESWCWATTVSEVSAYYKPDLIKDKSDEHCEALECQVVGNKLDPGKSPCCNSTKYCAPGQCCQGPKLFGGGVSCNDKCRGFAKVVDDLQCQIDSCKSIGGQVSDIATGITYFSGKKYVAKIGGPLTSSELDAILSKGHPVAMGVFWDAGGGHALVIGGCGGAGGPYYLHDSLDSSNSYQTLSYEKILAYTPPYRRDLIGHWFGTAVPSEDLPEPTESLVV